MSDKKALEAKAKDYAMQHEQYSKLAEQYKNMAQQASGARQAIQIMIKEQFPEKKNGAKVPAKAAAIPKDATAVKPPLRVVPKSKGKPASKTRH